MHVDTMKSVPHIGCRTDKFKHRKTNDLSSVKAIPFSKFSARKKNINELPKKILKVKVSAFHRI